jgi:hypothetical protein
MRRFLTFLGEKKKPTTGWCIIINVHNNYGRYNTTYITNTIIIKCSASVNSGWITVKIYRKTILQKFTVTERLINVKNATYTLYIYIYIYIHYTDTHIYIYNYEHSIVGDLIVRPRATSFLTVLKRCIKRFDRE